MSLRPLPLLLVLSLGISPAAQAISHKTWDDLSTVGAVGLTGYALTLPLLKDDWQGERQALYSVGTAGGLALLGKSLFPEQRPDNSDNNSFPSGHSALAFSSATTVYRRYGLRYALPAYAVATFTGAARVAAKKHHWYDVAAGAVIGTGSAWYFTNRLGENVAVSPWLDSDGGGVMVAMQW